MSFYGYSATMNQKEFSNSRFLGSSELSEMGFLHVGANVLIDKSAIFIGINNISIASNVRIDAFCFLTAASGEIRIEESVHIAASTRLFGSAGITVGKFSGISSGVSIFSQSDDYSGGSLANPLAPSDLRNVKSGRVDLMPYSLVGSNSVILPGVKIGKGASVGALTLVNKSIPDFAVVTGNPMRKIGERNSEKILTHEREQN